jgi:hypothetical protein
MREAEGERGVSVLTGIAAPLEEARRKETVSDMEIRSMESSRSNSMS